MSAPVRSLASIAAPAQVSQSTESEASAPRQNPAEKAAVDRGLAETRVESVRIDGLALMKIIKHARDAHHVIPPPATGPNPTASFSPAVGQLLGIDSEGSLEVSNSFGLPAGALDSHSDSETKGVKAALKYTQQFLPSLTVLNADASLVGFYASTNNGQQLAISGFVDALLAAQMAGGGIGAGQSHKAAPVGRSAAAKAPLPAGSGAKNGKGIALVYDVASAAQGYVGIKAYRLSAAFIEAYRAGKFDTASLIDHKLVPGNILEEVPVSVRSSPLLSAFLSTCVTPAQGASTPSAEFALPKTAISPVGSFDALSLPSTSAGTVPAPLTAPVSALLSALDTHQSHLSSLSFQSRQLARERTRIEALPNVQRRKAENEQRERDGLAPLPPTAEEASLVEPSRLETMAALNAVEGAAKVLSEATGTGLVRSYAARAGAIVA